MARQASGSETFSKRMGRHYCNWQGRFVPRAIAIVERILGKALPSGAVVHHADGDFTNDSPSNLVVCPNKAYHNLLHARMDALAACGNVDWVMCGLCKQYDAPENLYIRLTDGRRAHHRACHAANQLRRYYEKKRGQIQN